MTKNETEVLRISRCLTPEYREELLDRVRLACREEQAGARVRANFEKAIALKPEPEHFEAEMISHALIVGISV